MRKSVKTTPDVDKIDNFSQIIAQSDFESDHPED